jgi:hypothetical protein
VKSRFGWNPEGRVPGLSTGALGGPSNGRGPTMPFAPDRADARCGAGPYASALTATVYKAPVAYEPHLTSWGAVFGRRTTTSGDPDGAGTNSVPAHPRPASIITSPRHDPGRGAGRRRGQLGVGWRWRARSWTADSTRSPRKPMSARSICLAAWPWAHDRQSSPNLTATFIGLPAATFAVNGAAIPSDIIYGSRMALVHRLVIHG